MFNQIFNYFQPVKVKAQYQTLSINNFRVTKVKQMCNLVQLKYQPKTKLN